MEHFLNPLDLSHGSIGILKWEIRMDYKNQPTVYHIKTDQTDYLSLVATARCFLKVLETT